MTICSPVMKLEASDASNSATPSISSGFATRPSGGRPVQFEITPATRDAVQKWIKIAGLKSDDFVFPSRVHDSPHLGTRQYARILERWVVELGLDPADYGTHSMRRTEATPINRPRSDR